MLTRDSARVLFSRRTRRRFVWALVGSAVAALAEAAAIFAILPLMQLLTGSGTDQSVLGLLDRALGGVSEERLAVVLAVLVFAVFLAKGIFAIAFRWWVLGFMFEQESQTSVTLLRYYLTAPYGLHLRRNSADLLRTMNDAVAGTYQQVVVGVVNIFSELMIILAIGVALLVTAPGPAVLLLVYFALAGYAFYRLVRPTATRAGEQLLASWFTIYQGAMHAIGGLKEITIRQKTDFFLARYVSGRRELAGAQRTAVFFGEIPKYVFELLFIFGIALMTVFIFATEASAAALSLLGLFAVAGFRILPSAVRVLSSLNVARLGRPSLDVVVADLTAAAAVRTPDGPRPPVEPLRLTDRVEVRDVTFTHAGGTEPVLRDVSFTVPAGRAVALVGASGAGKSTMIDLLLGLHRPARGTITVDGVPIHERLASWQTALGLVPQDVYLLDDTLRANIAFGEADEEVDEERLERAVARAQLEELIAELPEGLDTTVGERGVRLSGGQRQRIGIARALYPEPELLILDEATSALDNETERRISQTVQGLHGQVTILIVAHRLSTVRRCDSIVFLKSGRVEAIGTFDELRAANADFAHQVELGSLT
ncbi:ABC transporter ATP-binding protein [uncultured Georgenia sp.]|uniref:ABC transporter ATP-binding protein n=1 Tax=uncultured Georgenia sp. TaxID=378209 RepID=UPI00260AAFC0|nr:ABC transporter ATP-binding protein [uncultured Georgenia sp.]HLV03692.1 ABC transporter ATP-binding protein [Actinomycetaceae bacterium]